MTSQTRLSLSDSTRTFILQTFAEMMDMCPGITGLIISSVDGHPIISDFDTGTFGGDMKDSRLSAMTSSLLALGESISKEAKQSLCKYVIVQNSDGYVITQRFKKALVLTAIANKNTNLGLLHSATRVGSEKLSNFNTEQN